MIDAPVHNRPVWRLEVGSYTEGWSLAMEEGDVVDRSDPVMLVEPFSFAWRYPKGAYPSQPEPEVASFTIRCKAAADVPDVAQGDQVYVRLYRPEPVGLPIEARRVYFEHDGTLQEPEATAERDGSMTLTLTSTDLTAELAEIPISDDPWPDGQGLMDRLFRIAYAAGVNINHTHPAVNMSSPLGPVDNDGGKSALDLVKLTLAGALFSGTDQLCLRGVRQLPNDFVPGGDGWIFGPEFPTVPVTYFLQPLQGRVGGAGPYAFVKVGSVLTIEERDLVAAMSEDQRLVLPTSAVEVGATWRKSRGDATNGIKLTGLDSAGGQVIATASYPDLVARYGANTRAIDTHNADNPYGTGSQLASYAKALLPEYAAAIPKWALPEFTFYPHLLPDAQLDVSAGKLYPHKVRSINAGMQIAASLLNIAPDWQLTGDDVHGTLTGATFTLRKGRLAIVGQLNGWKLRSYAPTWAQLRAAAETNAVKWRTGAVKLDPTLTWEDARQIGAI